MRAVHLYQQYDMPLKSHGIRMIITNSVTVCTIYSIIYITFTWLSTQMPVTFWQNTQI